MASNIKYLHSSQKRHKNGLYLSNQAFIVFFDQVLYHLIVSLPMVLNVWEAVIQRCSVKKVFLEMSQNWQENTAARAFF